MRLACAAIVGIPLILAGSLSAQRPVLSDQVKQRYVSLDTSTVAITGVTLIDGRGGAARKGQTVVIRDGKILDVGAGAKAPAGAYTIDGSGMTVIPGIVGMHDHLFYTAAGGHANQMSFTAPKLYLASGVTTIRTTGGRSPYAELNLKKGVDSGYSAGPRIYVTTPYLTGGAGGGSMFATDDPEAARRFVAYWGSEGVTWVKFYTDISRAAMKAAIEEAHKHGMKVVGHLCSVTFSEAIDLGLDDFGHGVLTATDFLSDKQPDKCPANVYKLTDSTASGDSPAAKALIAKMVKAHVSMTTTMAIFEALSPHRLTWRTASTSTRCPTTC
jgi:imidazolonepropionase-like amidohydrolase